VRGVEIFIALAGFVGAWLLFAGPLYQASIELAEEGFDRGELAAAASDIPQPPRISAWWWLLPPVAYVKTRRASQAYRDAAMRSLSRDQRERMIAFMSKANGWAIVAVGAFFIAVKETWELVEELHWPTWAFVVLLIASGGLGLVNTAVRAGRANRMLEEGA
jgi:hypothetical protein